MSNRKPRGYWTLERCMEDALRYTTRFEWQSENEGAYKAAYRKGWLKRCCEHMISGMNPKGYWTLERCMDDAAKYSSRNVWKTTNPSAVQASRREGWFDQCCEHMDFFGHESANDVVYIWRDAVTNLHKIGVTSDRIGEQRIGNCSTSNGMEPRIVFMLKVDDARAVESELLKLGTDPELDSSIDGYTEFRRLTDAELGRAVSIAYEAAIAA